MKLSTRGGKVIRKRTGALKRAFNASAPNDKDFGVVEAQLARGATDAAGTWFVRVSSLPSGITQARLVVFRRVEGVLSSYRTDVRNVTAYTWIEFGQAPDALAAEAGTLTVGVEAVLNGVPGRAKGAIPSVTLTTQRPDETDPPEFAALPRFTSQVIASTVFTYDAGTVLNLAPDSSVVTTFEQADTSDVASGTPVVVTGSKAPSGASGKYLAIVTTVTTPSLDSVVVGRSAWTFCASTPSVIALGSPPAWADTPTEGFAPAYSLGTILNPTGNQTVVHSIAQRAAAGQAISAVTLSSGKIPASGVEAEVAVKRVLTDASLPGDHTLTDYSAWTSVQKLPALGTAPSFSSSLTESTAFTKSDGSVLDGTSSTVVTISFEDATDNAGTGAAALAVSGLTMPAAVRQYVRIKRVVTDPLLTAAGISDRTDYSAWTACADASAAPPMPLPTFGTTTLGYSGTDSYFFPVVTSFSDHVSGDVYEWTTSLLSPIPDDQTETMATVTGGYRTQMDDAAKRVDPNSQTSTTRTDYSVFRFTGGSPWVLGEVRGQRVRFRRKRGSSPWSEWSQQYEVPLPASVTTTTGWQKRWIPLVTRAKEGYDAKIMDGPGLQFLRSFATTPANPNLILGAMDQNFPWQSDDFGETFYTPSWNGLYAGREGLSVWIDPSDANRRICAYCVQVPIVVTRALAGLYLSTDGGKTCTQVLSVPLTRGGQNIRHNMQQIASAPGGTPSTRTIYYMQVSGSTSASTVATIQLWRTTDGGSTWAKRGSELDVATFGSGDNGPYGLAVAPNGRLYQYGIKGTWYSDNGGTSWTKCTGFSNNVCNQIQIVGNNNVWVSTQDGLYKSTDGAAFAKNTAFDQVAVNSSGTKKPGAACRTFGISPADSNYMVAVKSGASVVGPIYSTNGGTSWSMGESHPRLGQDASAETVGNNDHYGIVPHQSDREKWFFHLGQHYGISTDHGQNIYAAGFLFDGSHTRGNIAFHPTDWRRFSFGQQDRASMTTQNGGLFWLEDDIGNPDSGKGKQIADAVAFSTYISGAGAIMTPGNRVVFQAGIASGKRVAVIFDQTVPSDPLTTKGTIGATRVTSWVSGLSDNAALDPYDSTKGYAGKFRLANLDAADKADVTAVDMTYFFVGLSKAGGATTIYGVENGNQSNKKIYRSTNGGAAWALWATTGTGFRPSDNRPEICPCPHANNRVYATADGKVVRIEGTSSPSQTVIFDCENYLPAGHPEYQTHTIAVDFFNPNLGYVSLYMWGVPNVFRTQNLLAASPTWESIATGDEDGLPHLDLELYVHPLTSDLFACGSHGTYVCKPPDGHKTTYGITNSVWETTDAYFKTIQD